MKNEATLINRVTAYFGTAYKAAAALDMKSSQYYLWVAGAKIPFKRGKQIEEATNGAIKAIEIWEEAGK